MTAELDQQCINTLRFLSVDMVQAANSGHPGLPLGAASLAYVLWTRSLKLNPRNPGWVDRDRFVLSAGHGSALLYALLHLTGYDLSLDDLKQFRQWGSKAPGHPERGHTPGVEVTTGPLGQGMANAVGMAIAEAQLAARYNRPDHGIIDHHTFALVSDGDLMEGVVAEAASLAGHLALGKLICLYDDNSITLAAGTDITFSENGACRFAAYGWHKVAVADGNDLAIVAAAERLRGQGIAVRCVSMPSWELFEALPQSERDAVLPPSVGARLAVELGVQQGWDRYIGAHGDMLGVQRFGASAPADVLLREYGFTVDNVCARARARLVR